MTVSTDSTSGTMAPAASPSTARAAMNAPAFGAYAHASDPRPNTLSAMIMTFLRPNRSPSSPPGSSATVSAKVYADMNHCRSVADACSDTASVGSATPSTVASSPTASTPSDSPPNAHHFRVPTLCACTTVMTLTTSRYQLQYGGYSHFSVASKS